MPHARRNRHTPRPPESERLRELSTVATILAQARGVRGELVDDVRTQVDDGGYMSEEKLNLAIYRMLKDVLA